MGDIRYNTETEEYAPTRALNFRGPPYGLVTDFILARGWAKTRRQAELKLVYISLACIAVVFALIYFGGSPEAVVITPEEAATLEARIP